jgi:cell division protein FtsL
MTAITLNLLAEEQLAEQAQARDPFRITWSVCLCAVLLCAMAGAWTTYLARGKKSELTGLEAKWESLSKDPGSNSGDTKSIKSIADELLTMNRGRTLYAQQLALIKDLVPPTIQFIRMSFQLNVDSPASDESSDTGGASKTARHRAKNVEMLVLQIDGRAISSRPEIEVDEFIKVLRADPVFSKGVKDIRLRSIARSPAGTEATANTVPSANFVIECQYKERR